MEDSNRRRRARAWTAALLFGAACWAGIGLGLHQAVGATSLADTPQFLARHGLAPAAPTQFYIAPQQQIDDLGAPWGLGPGHCGLTSHDPSWILVSDQARGPFLAECVLHEWMHRVAPGASEGHVQAVALDLLPNYWRWLTGKRLGAYIDSGYHEDEVRQLRRVSVSMTGQPWRTRAARQARVALMLTAAEAVA